MADPLLEVDGLTVAFDTDRGTVRAVNDVSYSLARGEALGIVGESGSGKSVHALAMLRLVPMPPARIAGSAVRLEGRDLLTLSPRALRAVRGRQVGFVFQDPMTSLHPMLSVGVQIREVLQRHMNMSRREADKRAEALLDLVRISDARSRLGQYPHELSGGMRQRVMIAIALACEPKLLIADEPSTALDVTIQAQILQIVRDLRSRFGMSIIWISHDLGVVAGLVDTLQVMYAGRILERGPVEDVFVDPRNAYTLGLLNSLPQNAKGERRRLTQIDGSPPDLRHLPAGDPFAPRNPYATDRCFREVPPLRQAEGAAPGHLTAAWYDLRTARAELAR